jgi:hypothetical protein
MGGRRTGIPKIRRCHVSPQMAFALSALILVIMPMLFVGGLLALKVLLILALSRDNEERRAALLGVVSEALKRR